MCAKKETNFTWDWNRGMLRNESIEREDSCKLIFSGDLSPSGIFEKKLMDGRIQDIFLDLLPIIRSVDFIIANLETVITSSELPIAKAGPSLKTNPGCFKSLKDAGFRIFCLANNHIMDYGTRGIVDTFRELDANQFQYLGAGRNYREATRALILEKNDIKIGILNMAETEGARALEDRYGACDISNPYLRHEFESLICDVDIVVVVFHGGIEFLHIPPPYIQRICREFADCGAHLVVGHHPHVPQGIEVYNGTPIVYSLGNLIFDMGKRTQHKYPSTSLGYMIQVEVTKNGLKRLDMIPYRIDSNRGCLHSFQTQEYKVFMTKFEQLSNFVREEKMVAEHWNHFVSSSRKQPAMAFYCSSFLNSAAEGSALAYLRLLSLLVLRSLKMRRQIKREKATMSNLLRTKAHYNLLLSIAETIGTDTQDKLFEQMYGEWKKLAQWRRI